MKNIEIKIAEILKLSQDKVDKLFPQIANMSIEQENFKYIFYYVGGYARNCTYEYIN